MRVLLLTPFAPNVTHDHAASDTLVQLVPRLGQEVDLTVYCPQVIAPTGQPAGALNYRLVGSSQPWTPGAGDKLGLRPGWQRASWPRHATRDVQLLVRELRPDVVHAEYLHGAEAIRGIRHSVLGMHDVAEQLMRRSLESASAGQWPYRLAELARTRSFERSAMRAAGAVITLSRPDHDIVRRFNSNVVVARPGVALADGSWSEPSSGASPCFVFAGAMWRRANALIAALLVREVMPRIWEHLPDARLRIVGARPPADVIALGQSDRRIEVTGMVADLRSEMLQSHAVLAPTIVGGGVLMKVLHAMACGCPVITSSDAAASVGADSSALFIADRADQIAEAAIDAVKIPGEAAARGHRARRYVERHFRWEDTVDAYLTAYRIARSR